MLVTFLDGGLNPEGLISGTKKSIEGPITGGAYRRRAFKRQFKVCSDVLFY